MHLHRIAIRNYRVLRDVELAGLGPMVVLVGANGVGKSTLFDALGFVRDTLVHGAGEACARRGGFAGLRSRGAAGAIGFELGLVTDAGVRLCYRFGVDEPGGGEVVMTTERLRVERDGVWLDLLSADHESGAIFHHDEAATRVAPSGMLFAGHPTRHDRTFLGTGRVFSNFPLITATERFLTATHLSELTPAAVRQSTGGRSDGLERHGGNLAAVARRIHDAHPERFAEVIERMRAMVPGLDRVEVIESPDKRLIVRFGDRHFADPFSPGEASDGTLKLFAQLVELAEPAPFGVLCAEEPENHLNPNVLVGLAEEFRDYGRRGGQVFVATHAPAFVDGARVDEVFWLDKHEGFTRAHAAAADPVVASLVTEGDHLGALWRQRLLGGDTP